MARVLVDDGRLFVLWNGFSKDVAWCRSSRDCATAAATPRAGPEAGPPELSGAPFRDVSELAIDWTWRRTIDQVVALFRTYSGSSCAASTSALNSTTGFVLAWPSSPFKASSTADDAARDDGEQVSALT